MKNILIITGSPRKNGNTAVLAQTFKDALAKNRSGAHIECVDAAKSALQPCAACEGCKKNGGNCVMPDGTAAIMDKVLEADALVFVSPVYWWGITAQIKTFIDKMYSKGTQFKEKGAKKIGVIIVGEAETDECQYRIIREQFECICEYLGWNFAFYQSVSANQAGEVAAQSETLAQTASFAAKF